MNIEYWMWLTENLSNRLPNTNIVNIRFILAEKWDNALMCQIF